MRSTLILLMLTCPVALAGAEHLLQDDLAGLIMTPADSKWSVEDGVLTPERGEEHAYVVTKARYGNVEITLEFNPGANTNSGVLARCQDTQQITPVSCYEFNIWDSHPEPKWRTGAIVLLAEPIAYVETEGRWNAMRIRLDGARMQVWINDTLTGDLEDDKMDEGHIAFQYGGDNGMVRFRNIRIVELN